MSSHEAPYVDDLAIENEAPLWRRVSPKQFFFDENRDCWRPSSAAFNDHPNGTPMSVVLGQEVLDAGRTAEGVLEGHEGYALASFTAGLVREYGQGIVRAPMPNEPAHAEVFGKKTKSVQRALAKNCQWVVPPPEGVG